MILNYRINLIRKLSLALFIFSLLSLIGSLWLQNTLANFKFNKGIYDEKVEISGILSKKIDCSKNLTKCLSGPELGLIKFSNKLGNCFKNKYEFFYKVDGKVFKDKKNFFTVNNEIKPQFKNKDIEVKIKFSEEKDETCIKNYKYFNFYEIFPYYHEFLYHLKDISTLGSQVAINPFIYGEASISNIVKRFPINLIFKPLLFISVIIMFLYWRHYNHLLREILNIRNNKFYLFGILSAIFLFFHVLFLGMEIDNKAFNLMRKLIIISFILSEVIAQFLLSLNLFKNKNILNIYCKTYIINIKLLFVILILLISISVLFILLIFNLPSKVDYILEWNYFAGLLFYYLLSALMWKKIINH